MFKILDIYENSYIVNINHICTISEVVVSIKDQYDRPKDKVKCFKLSFVNKDEVYITLDVLNTIFNPKESDVQETQDKKQDEEQNEKQDEIEKINL